MENQIEEILTVQDVCRVLMVGRNRVYELLESGKLHGFRLGHVWKIPRHSLNEFILTCGYSK